MGVQVRDEAVADLATPIGPAEHLAHPPRRALARSRGGLAAIGAAIVGFVGLFAIVRARRSDAIDAALTLRLQAVRRPGLARLMRAISWPGFPPQSRLIAPSLAGLLWAAGLRLEAAFQLGAWSSALVATLAKRVTRRPRPLHPRLAVVLAPLGGTSFPSGHVLTYAGVYGFFAYVVHAHLRPVRLRRAIVAGLMALIGLVGPSRIHQGHHWPTDVLASYLLGLPFLAFVVEAYQVVKRRGLRARAHTLRAEAREIRAAARSLLADRSPRR